MYVLKYSSCILFKLYVNRVVIVEIAHNYVHLFRAANDCCIKTLQYTFSFILKFLTGDYR